MASRILILANMFSPNVGGLETHLDDLCAYLDNKKYKAWVIAYQPLTTCLRAKHIEKRGTVEIHRISWFGHDLFYKLNSRPILEFAYMFPGLFVYTLFFMLRNGKKVDVIHAQGMIPSCVAWTLNVIFKKRMVMSTHSIYEVHAGSPMANLFKRILASFNTILCLSHKSKEELVHLGISPKKIDVFNYWVDQEIFRPIDHDESNRKFGWDDHFIVLFVGRLVEEKGVRTLLKAAERLRAFEKLRFVFIGDGPLVGAVRNASEVNGNIIFIGKVRNENLNLYYSAADVVVVPSINEEGFGRVILESLACGTPVIASNRGGIPEALDSSMGMLIEPTADDTAGVVVVPPSTSYKGFPRVILETVSCGTPVIGSKRGSITEALSASVGLLTEPDAEEIADAIIHLAKLRKSEMRLLRERCWEYARDRFSSNNAEVILKAYESG